MQGYAGTDWVGVASCSCFGVSPLICLMNESEKSYLARLEGGGIGANRGDNDGSIASLCRLFYLFIRRWCFRRFWNFCLLRNFWYYGLFRRFCCFCSAWHYCLLYCFCSAWHYCLLYCFCSAWHYCLLCRFDHFCRFRCFWRSRKWL